MIRPTYIVQAPTIRLEWDYPSRLEMIMESKLGPGGPVNLFIARYVKRYITPYVPKWTGALRRSAIIGRDIQDLYVLPKAIDNPPRPLDDATEGAGAFIIYNIRYAEYQYMFGRNPGTKRGFPLQGKYWGMRWFIRNQNSLTRAAENYMRQLQR